VWVGKHAWSYAARNFLKMPQFAGRDIPVFDTLDEALAYVYAQI
jgi:hypothetical protein